MCLYFVSFLSVVAKITYSHWLHQGMAVLPTSHCQAKTHMPKSKISQGYFKVQHLISVLKSSTVQPWELVKSLLKWDLWSSCPLLVPTTGYLWTVSSANLWSILATTQICARSDEVAFKGAFQNLHSSPRKTPHSCGGQDDGFTLLFSHLCVTKVT